MKKTTILFILLFIAGIMQAQVRPQPKPGKPPVVNINKPQTFVLDNGLKVMVVENHKLPKVTFNLSIDNPPFAEARIKGVDDLCSNLIGSGNMKITKDDFNEEVDFLGANIGFNSHGAYASSLSKYSGRILQLLSYGALYPNFTQEEFDKEKAKLLEAIKSQEKSASAIANRVVHALAFGVDHPSGEYMTEETINNITLDDVKANYNAHFAPDNAYLVIIGDIKFNEVKPIVEKLFGSWKKMNTPEPTYPDPKNVAFTQINFVDVPNAAQSEVSLVSTLRLKMSDKDFFPAVIATYILGGDYSSYLNMNLREAHGWTYGANAIIGAGKYVTKLRAASSVRTMATDSAVVEFIKEIKRIRTEKVAEDVLNNVKAGYIGRFVMKVEKPETIARHALNIETEDLPKDFYENYIKIISAVTAEDVLKAANKYFLIDNMRIVIAGKGSEVLPGLEKLNIPLYQFDKWGNPIEKKISTE
ncbi:MULTISPECIES: M16 family metallopeptidase [unclassified Flavobacterium]|uniref:M16 family metallopeptidase n=1 Tax=unclassified Flavobacterium TaxID=196869 RepID=UPI003F934C42